MTEERFNELLERRKALLAEVEEIDAEIEKAGKTFEAMDRALRTL